MTDFCILTEDFRFQKSLLTLGMVGVQYRLVQSVQLLGYGTADLIKLAKIYNQATALGRPIYLHACGFKLLSLMMGF